MKSLVLSLALLSTSLMASEVKVMEMTEDQARYGVANIEQVFNVNEELSRVWIEVSVTEYASGDGSVYSEDYRVKLDDLSFDKETGSINLVHEGQIVECGKYGSKGRWVFRHKSVKLSERCQFTQKWVKTTYDDGFEIKTTRKLKLSLIVK